MQFSTVAFFAAAVAVVAAAPHTGGPSSTGSCSAGTPQCCATTHSGAEAKKTGALLGLNDLAGMVGISCQQIPINIIGVAANVDNYCKATPVCCTGSTNNGLVQTGCTPLSVN